MFGYVDLYVLAVPKKFIPTYRKISTKMGKVMRKYGCLEYREFLGDDLHPKFGMVSPLKLVKVKKGQVLVFAVTGFKSKAQRNQVLKRTMQDPIVKKMCKKPMPLDCKKMVYGGFKTIVKA